MSGGARAGDAPTPGPRPGLAVLVDGHALPPTEAREFWARFSAYMEEHKGDLAGFAMQEGFASVHPSMKDGAPVLLASRTSLQRPYVSVTASEGGKGSAGRGGSSDHQAPPRDPAKGGGKRRKGPKRRP